MLRNGVEPVRGDRTKGPSSPNQASLPRRQLRRPYHRRATKPQGPAPPAVQISSRHRSCWRNSQEPLWPGLGHSGAMKCWRLSAGRGRRLQSDAGRCARQESGAGPRDLGLLLRAQTPDSVSSRSLARQPSLRPPTVNCAETLRRLSLAGNASDEHYSGAILPRALYETASATIPQQRLLS